MAHEVPQAYGDAALVFRGNKNMPLFLEKAGKEPYKYDMKLYDIARKLFMKIVLLAKFLKTAFAIAALIAFAAAQTTTLRAESATLFGVTAATVVVGDTDTWLSGVHGYVAIPN